jgi:signal transduction histidine kinase
MPYPSRIATGASLLAIAIGVMVLVGWAVGSDALISIHPRFIAMLPSTAVGAILGGGAIALLQFRRIPRRTAIARMLGVLLVAFGVLSLASRVVGHALAGIDRLFYDRVALYSYRPVGVVASNSALVFIMAGIGIFLITSARPRHRTLARIAAILGLGLAGVALLGHLYGASALYTFDFAAGMALLTALQFFGICVAILFFREDDPGVSLLTGKDLAGSLMRRMLPASALFLVAMGLALKTTREEELVSRETGIAMFVVLSVIWFVAMMLRSAHIIRVANVERSDLLERERESRAAAEAANRAKSDFLAMMSHELRTPLNAIVGYVSLMTDGVGGTVHPTHEQNLGRIRDNARHLTHVVDEVLTLARIESGKEEVIRGPTDVSALLSEVAGMIAPLATAKGLTLTCECAAPIIMQTDAHRLRQILVNLAGNAVKFTATGGITMRAEREGDHLLITVRDTGIGIAPVNLERIFEEFWQAERPLTRVYGGTGLGLSVSRRLARLLGGDLTVTSAVNEGSTFRLTLPEVAPAATVAPVVLAEARASGSALAAD